MSEQGIGMLYIPAVGDITYVTFPDDDFRRMAEKINAKYIERVRVGTHESMAVDDEGLYSDKPLNLRASFLYGTHKHGAPIIGDALLGIEAMTMEGAVWAAADEKTLRARLRSLIDAMEDSNG